MMMWTGLNWLITGPKRTVQNVEMSLLISQLKGKFLANRANISFSRAELCSVELVSLLEELSVVQETDACRYAIVLV
jgi:hypothetical protein